MFISIFDDEIAGPAEIIIAMNRLKAVFPKMQPEFYNILTERICVNSFTKKRLENAVNRVIDNFRYKELNVSDIISFDKRVKLYTHNEVCNMVTRHECAFSDFEVKKVDGSYYRVKKADLK